MKNKSLFIDGIIYSIQKYGGISTVFNELLKRLPDYFYELGLFNNNYFNLNFEIPIKLEKERLFERYKNCNIYNNYSIFHSTYYRVPNNKNVKIIQTVHDFIYEKFQTGLRKQIHTIQKSNAIKNSDFIICVSNNTKNDLIDLYGTNFENKCIVIHNAASSDFYQIPDISKLNQILFIGNRKGYKNFNSIIKAISLFNDFTLVVVGDQFTFDEINLLEKYIPKKYKNLGNISNEKLNLEYNKSFCLIYPSLYEGFGIPILEAMQSGCPVIAYNNSSIPELIDNPDFLLNYGTTEELLFKLESILIMSKRDELINYGLSRSKLFNWDHTYNKTMDLYNSLL